MSNPTENTPPDGEELIMTSLRITKTQADILEFLKTVTGLSKGEIQRRAIDRHLKKFFSPEWLDSEMEKHRAKLVSQIAEFKALTQPNSHAG